MDKLFVAVLGNQDSGKSMTWNTLFEAKVRTGKTSRHLPLYNQKCCEVFLISGSPEERAMYAGDILQDSNCRVVLCSIQYTEAVEKTLNFAKENGYNLFVQWLNPGHGDLGPYFDELGLAQWLLANNSTISMRNGKNNPTSRTEEIRQFIYGWTEARNLTCKC